MSRLTELIKKHGKAKVFKVAGELGHLGAIKFIENLDRKEGDTRTPGEVQGLMRKHGVKDFGEARNAVLKLEWKLYNQKIKDTKKKK